MMDRSSLMDVHRDADETLGNSSTELDQCPEVTTGDCVRLPLPDIATMVFCEGGLWPVSKRLHLRGATIFIKDNKNATL